MNPTLTDAEVRRIGLLNNRIYHASLNAKNEAIDAAQRQTQRHADILEWQKEVNAILGIRSQAAEPFATR